jgi:anthranilate synthase/aminodeoxychorismate synthase-like glutamine amidotransferase
MILLIDNYDSFVYNLHRYLAELGYSAEVFRNDAIRLEDIQSLSPSHIILSPGPCTPNEAGICLPLIEKFKKDIPILGICLGHQAIAQACGAQIIRSLAPKHGKGEKIFHAEKDLFKQLPNPFIAARYHSLLIEKETLPPCFEITALSQQNEIMAIRHRNYRLRGVQFHPESILTEFGYLILKQFMELK